MIDSASSLGSCVDLQSFVPTQIYSVKIQSRSSPNSSEQPIREYLFAKSEKCRLVNQTWGLAVATTEEILECEVEELFDDVRSSHLQFPLAEVTKRLYVALCR